MATPLANPWDAFSSVVTEPSAGGSVWDTFSSPVAEQPDGVSFAPDGAPAGLRNVPTAPSDPVFHGAVPIAQAPDQGAPTAFGSGVGGAPIIGPTILKGEQQLAAYARSLRYGTSFDAELQHVQDMTDAARQQHPGAAFAGDLTGAATALAPVVGAAPEVFGLGGGGLSGGKIIAGGLSGAAIGGADAAARNGADPNAIAYGAGAGVVGGAAAPVIGAGFSRLGQGAADLYGYLRSPNLGVSRPAATIIRNTLANDGNLGPQGLANIGAAGPRGMLVDASPSLSGVLDGALQHGGPGALAARQAIDARAAGSGQDMTAALDQAFGPPQGVLSATDALRNGSAQARQQAYDVAYAAPIDYTSPEGRALESMVANRVPPGIIARAQRQMQVDGVLPSQQRMASIANDGTVTYHQMEDHARRRLHREVGRPPASRRPPVRLARGCRAGHQPGGSAPHRGAGSRAVRPAGARGAAVAGAGPQVVRTNLFCWETMMRTNISKSSRHPDLPDIMAAGMGLSEALAWWNAMMQSGEAPEASWRRLSGWRGENYDARTVSRLH